MSRSELVELRDKYSRLPALAHHNQYAYIDNKCKLMAWATGDRFQVEKNQCHRIVVEECGASVAIIINHHPTFGFVSRYRQTKSIHSRLSNYLNHKLDTNEHVRFSAFFAKGLLSASFHFISYSLII